MHGHFPSTHFTRVFAVPTFFFAWFVVGCGQERFNLIGPQATVSCPPKLADRLKLHRVPVEKPIAWQRRGYDGFPSDERIALAVAPNGEAYLAWLEAVAGRAGTSAILPDKGVHITPLDKTLARRGPDTVHATGLEVSGLVAHDDGFALLIKDANPGENIESDGDGNTVPFLLRYKGGIALFSEPLAGSASKEKTDVSTIYSPMVMGQLIWNGSTYGAYFTVKGGLGDPSMGVWRDLLVYRNPIGQPTQWLPTRGCTNNGGIRLISDNGKLNSAAATQASAPDMTGICVQQKPSEVKFTEFENDEKVSVQEVGWAGYSGAKFGSLLKIPDGYLVFWLSLGATNVHEGHDIRMAKLSREFKLVAGPTWLTHTPRTEEWNLHVVPYGDNFLMIYNQIAIRESNSNYAVYLGDFQGTHLRLLDAEGRFISEDEVVQGSPITENDGPVIFSNGDVGWAFVNPTPDYSKFISKPVGSTFSEFSIARFQYCR